MASYESFARVYDLFMDNIPYEEWCGYLHTLLEKYDVTDGLVLELGCGTGTMTELLADCGYDMIGVDNSADMLEIALEKKEQSGKIRNRLHELLCRRIRIFAQIRQILFYPIQCCQHCGGWRIRILIRVQLDDFFLLRLLARCVRSHLPHVLFPVFHNDLLFFASCNPSLQLC